MDERLLVETIHHHYPLRVVAAALLRESADNSVWLLRASPRRRYVARVSKRAEAQEIAFEAAWINRLYDTGVPVARAIATNHGLSAVPFGHGSELLLESDLPPAVERLLHDGLQKMPFFAKSFATFARVLVGAIPTETGMPVHWRTRTRRPAAQPRGSSRAVPVSLRKASSME
jgi:aminoglycoside phosphotransferase (APT) family kinase protein